MSIVSTILVKTTSTKSFIIYVMENVPQEFIDWLNSEMERGHLGIRELAREIGVSHPTISDILSHQIKPSFDTTVLLAKKFNREPAGLLRLAGLLPPDTEQNQVMKEICYLAGKLPIDKQINTRDYIRFMVEMAEKEK